MNLSRLALLVGGHGEPVNGCDLPTDEAQALARARYAHQSFCLVRDWTILDLERPMLSWKRFVLVAENQ